MPPSVPKYKLSAVAVAHESATKDCFINAFPLKKRVPQGLKPAFFQALNGTAEAVPYPKPIYETRSTSKRLFAVMHPHLE